MKQRNLLDELAVSLQLEYLSDLRRPELQQAALQALKRLSPDDYPAAQWNDALEYILDRKTAFSSAADAFQYLCSI